MHRLIAVLLLVGFLWPAPAGAQTAPVSSTPPVIHGQPVVGRTLTVEPGSWQPSDVTLTYPDGAHNAETLLADRHTGELVIVTKTVSGHSGIYSADLSAGARQTLELRGHIDFGLAGLTTAGDVSADGRTIAIRTYGDLSVWHRRSGTSIASTLATTSRCLSATSLAGEGQGESLALTPNGASFYTIPEGASPPLRHYSSTLHP